MGQKSNLITLRKKKKTSLLNFKYNDFLYGHDFLKGLSRLFFKKKIFLTDSSLNLIGNQSILTLELFFRTAKLNRFKRKIKFTNIFLGQKKCSSIRALSKLYYKALFRVKTNLIVLNIVNLNKKPRKKLFKVLFYKFKRFHYSIFPRRFNFFIDFLKISALFFNGKIKLDFFTITIGQIFKILPKKRHNFFLLFIQQLFKSLIVDRIITNKKRPRGVKLMLSGRIQAKPRAKFKYFQLGSVPMQLIDLDVDFSKTHINTIYGVFGLKIWVYRLKSK